MDRYKFKNMSDSERIEWVKERYKEGLTTGEIVKKYNIPKNTLGDTFRRNGYASDKKLKIYVKTEDEHVNNSYEHVYSENVEKSYIKETKNKDNKAMLELSKHENNSNMLELPTDIKKELLNMVGWYKKQQDKEEEREEVYSWIKKQMQLENKIVNVAEIQIDKEKLTGEVKTRSFTIYSNVLEKFNGFCKEKPYSKQDLLSMALLEYIEKYK